MARVTIEDCLDKIDNRFRLVLVAAKRARQIDSGVGALVDEDNDKSTVIALREIADGKIGTEVLDTVTAAEHVTTSTLSDEDVRANISE